MNKTKQAAGEMPEGSEAAEIGPDEIVDPLGQPVKTAALIYCGPSLPQGVLWQYAIYKDGIPAHLAKHINACPAVERLFVPIKKLVATEVAMVQPGTPQYIWAAEIFSYIKKGVNVQ